MMSVMIMARVAYRLLYVKNRKKCVMVMVSRK